MRRYHAASKCYAAKSPHKPTDLSFLLQREQIPTSRVQHGASYQSADARSQLPTTTAMKQLSNAVRHRKYDAAEKLFKLSPRLGTRQGALRLLIKMYCDQRDFTSAKAILHASLDKVGEKGVARYIFHCTFGSQNAADIQEVYSRWCAHNPPSSELAGIALLGSRFLGDTNIYDLIWRQTSQFWEPSLKAPTLMAKVLDLLLEESWENAFKVWRIASGMGSFVDVRRPGQVFYFACRYFLVEAPNVDAVNAILKLMRRLDLKVNAALSALLLRHLAPMFPDSSLSDWIGTAQQRGWPINDDAVEALIRASSKRFESAGRFSREVYQYGMRQMKVNGLSVKRSLSPVEGLNDGGDLKMLKESVVDDQVFERLDSMLTRGLHIPYYYYVVAFRLLIGWNSPRLPQLISQMQSRGYPLHCAGIDLAVVQSHCRENGYNLQICRELVAEFLVQYPLIDQNRTQVTELGLIMWHAGDLTAASYIVDSIRGGQVGYQKYNSSNHDSASLELLLRCRLSMGEPLAPFVRSVLADRPAIFFDRTFTTSLRKMLRHRSEDENVISELSDHNEALKHRCFKEIDDLVAVARAAMLEEAPKAVP